MKLLFPVKHLLSVLVSDHICGGFGRLCKHLNLSALTKHQLIIIWTCSFNQDEEASLSLSCIHKWPETARKGERESG